MTTPFHGAIAILPCNELDVPEAFYARLGFKRWGGEDGYRILHDDEDAAIHLTQAVKGWLVPGRNPFGLYLAPAKVDPLAEQVRDLLRKPPEDKPWGIDEFALSDPDQTLVRVGWPTRLRT